MFLKLILGNQFIYVGVELFGTTVMDALTLHILWISMQNVYITILVWGVGENKRGTFFFYFIHEIIIYLIQFEFNTYIFQISNIHHGKELFERFEPMFPDFPE